MDSRESRSERKKKEARERILKAAEQLFMIEGNYEKCTIRDIAQRSDVSVGAVYLCFKNKIEMLAELVYLHSRRIREQLQAVVGQKKTGAEKLIAILDLFLTIRDDPQFKFYGRFSMERYTDLANSRVINVIQSEYIKIVDMVEEIFRIGNQDKTIIATDDCRLAATVFIQMTHSFVRDLLLDLSPTSFLLPQPYSSDALITAFITLVREALCVKKDESAWIIHQKSID
jgi:AcrR family transcriptional regulator